MLEDNLLNRVVMLLAAIVGLMLLAGIARLRSGRATVSARMAAAPLPATTIADAGAPAAADAAPVPFRDGTIETLALTVYRRAFGTANFNYAILGEHEAVLARVRRAIPQAATRREYFPRKPLVIPRLLGAIKNSSTSLKELVDIIMQDPVLTGDLLRIANSPVYRISRESIDSIGRAVVLLGLDGLRSLIATSVMQPVFQTPRGYFEDFSDTVWRNAQYSALAAQTYARELHEGDSFAAHLLALLVNIGHIVLFRMTVASYLLAAGSLPRAEVFTRLLDECSEALAVQIAAEWDLPEGMRLALAEHEARTAVNAMSPLGRALYFGRICGLAATAAESGALDEQELLALLVRKGMPPESAASLWRTIATRVTADA